MKLLKDLIKTPFHPQWFAMLRENEGLREMCGSLSGLVLDIGCAERKPRAFLPDEADYVGLDYFDTATAWYGTRPDVFGDAQQLPFGSESVDHVLLMDVLEHIPEPDLCLGEIHRVLKPGGTLSMQIPFMYPVHDDPLDFHRWTRSGLQRAARSAGFAVHMEKALGHPLETAALSANIAMSKTCLNWVSGRNPLMILTVGLPFFVLFSNLLAWTAARLSRTDELMPYAYRTVWAKS
jgi:SAM-dependent methyltransferase